MCQRSQRATSTELARELRACRAVLERELTRPRRHETASRPPCDLASAHQEEPAKPRRASARARPAAFKQLCSQRPGAREPCEALPRELTNKQRALAKLLRAALATARTRTTSNPQARNTSTSRPRKVRSTARRARSPAQPQARKPAQPQHLNSRRLKLASERGRFVHCHDRDPAISQPR